VFPICFWINRILHNILSEALGPSVSLINQIFFVITLGRFICDPIKKLVHALYTLPFKSLGYFKFLFNYLMFKGLFDQNAVRL